MRMLDIDMDFFQTGIHCWEKDTDTFLADEKISVWEDKEIIYFLEKRCGLDKNNKIKGRLVKHHVEAYSFWGKLVNSNKDMVPFEVTHIDAHSDLAYSSNIPFYRFIKSLNDQETQKKLNEGTIFFERESLINSGNYLLASIIIGWVNNVKYVFHPDLDFLDVFEYIVENVEPNKLFRFNFCDYIKKKDVYLELVSSTSFYCDKRFDYATIALSPPYVNKEMEDKLDIIKEYIDII
jgi:hypothetical protein